MITSGKQLSSQSTTDTFDEIYTNYDISVSEEYLAQTGYPFDYPARWLNDPSQNKRIAVRRLDVTLSAHSFSLKVTAAIEESTFEKTATMDVTYADNLTKVLNFMCSTFSYTIDVDDEEKVSGLSYEYDVKTNHLELHFLDTTGDYCEFAIKSGKNSNNNELYDFLRFLNQPVNAKARAELVVDTTRKEFDEVWNRDRIHFHASFSTSRRKFIGKKGDFYQNLTLLYPPPTNESTFYIRFTSNGVKNILIRYCEFDVQLCFIVNYKKAIVL